VFELKADAFAREKEIKKWKSRKKIEELIKAK
jgi:predicted GIY-YIG superfamily endonuclease